MRFRSLLFSETSPYCSNLTRKGEYRNSVTEHRPAFALHLALLAVAAAGADRQILHAFYAVGDGRRTDTDAHMIRPEFFSALGVERHDVARHFAREHQVAGGG